MLRNVEVFAALRIFVISGRNLKFTLIVILLGCVPVVTNLVCVIYASQITIEYLLTSAAFKYGILAGSFQYVGAPLFTCLHSRPEISPKADLAYVIYTIFDKCGVSYLIPLLAVSHLTIISPSFIELCT